MRTRFWLPLVLVLVPAAASAQGWRGAGRMQGARRAPQMLRQGAGAGLQGGPAQMLLDRREELGLTEEQVSRLETLAGEWTAAHDEMRAALEQFRANRRQLNEEQREQLQAFRERAQAAGENARKGIDDLLTGEQRTRLRNRPGLLQRGQVRPGAGGAFRRGGMMRGGAGVVGPARRPGVVRQPQVGWGGRAMAPQWQGRLQGGRVLGPAQRLQARRQALLQRRALRLRWWLDPDTLK